MKALLAVDFPATHGSTASLVRLSLQAPVTNSVVFLVDDGRDDLGAARDFAAVALALAQPKKGKKKTSRAERRRAQFENT